MKYFLLQQETNGIYPNVIQFDPEMIVWDQSSQYLPVKPYTNTIGFFAHPLLESSLFLISEEMHQIFTAYQIGAKSKLVALDDPQGKSLFYYLYQPPILSCLHETSQLNPDHTMKHIVLDQIKIGVNKIFQIAWILENYLIVDFEILELLLAQGIYPFRYKELDLYLGGES